MRMSALPEIYADHGRTHSSDYDGVRVQLFDAYMTLAIMHPIKPIANYWAFVVSSARNGETF
jgi:hypothetical protein